MSRILRIRLLLQLPLKIITRGNGAESLLNIGITSPPPNHDNISQDHGSTVNPWSIVHNFLVPLSSPTRSLGPWLCSPLQALVQLLSQDSTFSLHRGKLLFQTMMVISLPLASSSMAAFKDSQRTIQQDPEPWAAEITHHLTRVLPARMWNAISSAGLVTFLFARRGNPLYNGVESIKRCVEAIQQDNYHPFSLHYALHNKILNARENQFYALRGFAHNSFVSLSRSVLNSTIIPRNS